MVHSHNSLTHTATAPSGTISHSFIISMGNNQVSDKSNTLNNHCRLMSWGGGYLANFLRSVFFRIFQYHQNTRYLLNIAFIFDRCRRSSAAVAPVKYKFDSNNVRGTFARTKILLTEKLTNGALVTPTPGIICNSG